MCQNRFNGNVVTGGKLFKITSSGIVSEVSGWTNDNGSVVSLAVASNGTIYVGNYVYKGKSQRKLFEKNNW